MTRFASERDFVATYLFPELKEAAKQIGVVDVLDFHVEKPINGTPDLTAEKGGRGLFIVEAKFKKKIGRIERDIEPRDPAVIAQAINYAAIGGFPYYATCNSKRIVLFQLRPPLKPFESEVASFEYELKPKWAESFLKTVLELVPIKLKPLDDTLVETLREAFNDLRPEFLKSLEARLREVKFREKYIDWLKIQGIRLTEESSSLIAEQTTYLQLNKLLFYQVIRAIYPDRLKPLIITEEEDVADALTNFFVEARKIDYLPIYQSDVISEIPFTAKAKERIRTLLDTINEFDFSKIEGDFIGRIYEKLISPLERKRLGQFYTPPSIVDLIVQLTVSKPNVSILDPGCGSGSFLVRAYHRLRELNHIPRVMEGPLAEKFHLQLLEHLYGVDINQFPAHLTVINLAVQNPKAKIRKVNVAVGDIFDVKSRQATLLGFESITTEGKPTLIEMPPAFDVVVANPPYIRQELLGEKEKLKIKSLIESEYRNKLFIGALSKKVKESITLDKQSDTYIYFYIHGLSFLKNGGKLGFISSNKWLEVGYGEPFQQFLLDNTKILYVIEFDNAVFPDAEVNTEVTILEKASGRENQQSRTENKTKFIRINSVIPLDQLIKRLQTEDKADDENLTISTVRQDTIRPGKWNVYLRAPQAYFKLVSNPRMKTLEEIAEVVRGYTTGYDPYFVISKEEAKEWGIEDEFLKPCAPPGKALEGFVIRPEDISQYFLMVHSYPHELKGSNVLEYIKHGEKLDAIPSKRRKKSVKLLKVETIKNRKPWYSLPERKTPSILFPMWFRYKYRPLLNNGSAHGQDFYYHITVDQNDKEILTAFLYSTMTQFLLEIIGRQYSGMLHIKAYELRALPILDPAELESEERKKLKQLMWKLNDAVILRNETLKKFAQFKAKAKGHEGLFEKDFKDKLEKAKVNEAAVISQIDEIIYDKLGLTEKDREAISTGLKHLRQIRKLATRGLKAET